MEGVIMGARPGADAVSALLRQRVQERPQAVSAAARKVIDYIARNPAQALARSAADIGIELGLSDATVIRAIQGLGFPKLADLRHAVAAALESTSPAARMQRTLGEMGEDVAAAIDTVLDTQQEALTALRTGDAKRQMAAAVRVLGAAERIVVFGIGPSGVVAQYAAMLLTRVGRPARSLDAAGIALADQLLDLRPGDVLLLLAYGRAYPEVVATVAQARRLGAPIVLLTDSLEERLARDVQVVVPVRRGRAERVALHGATLTALEALILGLAALDRPRTLAALEQLNELRAAVGSRYTNSPTPK
jgi:DNA-binding MurR/RpiR family transcriptional regulator